MSLELLFAFVAFAFVTSITPGPNNLMLLASGVNFGVRRSMPHMAGVCIGFTVMVAVVGLGLSQVFERMPVLHLVLRYVGAAYLLYLAWKIAYATSPAGDGQGGTRPLTFLQAAGFQWVNPKAWVMAIGAIATYTPQGNFTLNVMLIALVFGLVNAPSIGLWTITGSLLRHWLEHPRARRTFNIGMALLLVASLYPIVSEMGLTHS
ncbi:LysE family translocator [Pseudomonas matsuisoli]|uniref:Protein AmbA n=1 Tax=Pseudomonas matsuisoli TaxID=1515666 RepID=A0A917PTY5_9PSED|nr:LysE family translocator [Pseudomonas matsuisoli]GGJ91183.1 protein AmbA [Pseudomonas matsuisoli]